MFSKSLSEGEAAMAEWLRRWTWNPMGSPRAGSNPARSGYIFLELFYVTRNIAWTLLPSETGQKENKALGQENQKYYIIQNILSSFKVPLSFVPPKWFCIMWPIDEH